MLACCCDLICVNSLTLGAQRDKAGFLSLLGFTFIVYSFVADIVIFDESMKALAIVGCLLCFLSTFAAAVWRLIEAHKERKKAESMIT